MSVSARVTISGDSMTFDGCATNPEEMSALMQMCDSFLARVARSRQGGAVSLEESQMQILMDRALSSP